MKDIVEEYKTHSESDLMGVFSKDNIIQCEKAVKLVKDANTIFLIGNGGSHASCCLHIAEDLIKVANKKAMTLENPSLITCLANDYGYDLAYVEWLKRFWGPKDLLIAISSSGESNNINNAVDFINDKYEGFCSGNIITFSAHKKDNRLRNKGKINFYLPTTNYGAAEIYHSLWLHMILDQVVKDNDYLHY